MSTMMSFLWPTSSLLSHGFALICLWLIWQRPWRRKETSRVIKQTDVPVQPRKQKQTSRQTLQNAPLSPVVSVATESDDDPSDDKSVDFVDQEIEKACPDATATERRRFLTARSRDVPATIKSLNHYLDWVRQHEEVARTNDITRITSDDPDHDIWIEVCRIAIKTTGEACEQPLPRVIRTHQLDGKAVVDATHRRIVHIIPAQMDDTLVSGSTYALATALYIDKLLDRAGDERITVCMDVRAGRGWPNVHVMRQIPFMQQTTILLLSLFPERLNKCLLYPVPPSFLWIWNVVKNCIDPLTRDKIILLAGPNKIEAPPPYDEMAEHMDEKIAKYLEHARVSKFVEEE